MKKLIRITTVPISLDILLGDQLSYMNQFYEVTAVSADKKELERIAEKYGVKNHAIEMTRTISPLKDIAAAWNLYRFLRKEKPFIVHSHTPKAGIVGMMAAWLAGVPHRFHTVAGLPLMESEGLKRTLLKAIEKLTYRFATKVYPNSFELQKIILAENFCPPEKLKVIGIGSSNGIDTAYFNRAQISEEVQQNLKTDLGITEKDFVYIFVGRLVKDKGINELVSAFASTGLSDRASTPLSDHAINVISDHASTGLSDHAINVSSDRTSTGLSDHRTPKLLLVGPFEKELDPLKPETLAEIRSNPNIISVGFQQEVRPYFAISNALVFPSYREGFPNVVLQSLAMNLPAIVSDINGCNEIITSFKNGLLIPAKDPHALKIAMEEVLNDELLYQKLKRNTTESIAPYQQQAVWEALLEEYRKA